MSESVKELLEILIQVIIVVVPVLITWFIRTYIKGSTAERDFAAIASLSNMAIDYAENMDLQGKLELSPEMSKGLQKLNLASDWLLGELNRADIKMSNEEAQKWISAEFQKRVGDVRMVGAVAKLTTEAVDVISDLEKRELIDLPSDLDRITYLTSLGADWVVAGLAKSGVALSREEALTYVRAELMRQFQLAGNNLPTNEQLIVLAKRAIAFLEEIKASGKLNLEGASESDITMAWMLTETAKQGLSVTPNDISTALNNVMRA